MKATILFAMLLALAAASAPAHALRFGPFAGQAKPVERRMLISGYRSSSTLSQLAQQNTKANIQMAMDSSNPMATHYATRAAVADTMLATVGGPYAVYGLTAPRPVIV
jgi:hypothetical protein